MQRQLCRLAIPLFLAASFAHGGEAPAHVVREFYRWRITPSPQEIENYRSGIQYESGRSLLGKELMTALQAQSSYQKACARLTPGIKPYMIDQDIFFLGPDGAKALVSVTAKITDNFARASVNLSYDEIRWTDHVLLKRDGGALGYCRH